MKELRLMFLNCQCIGNRTDYSNSLPEKTLENIFSLKMYFNTWVTGKKPPFLCFFLADLFDILLPMLNIYQEFVRNHQYSLQVLANCKQNRDFDKLLKQYEANPACEGRMLETFLTYPMFQVLPVSFFVYICFYCLVDAFCVTDIAIDWGLILLN